MFKKTIVVSLMLLAGCSSLENEGTKKIASINFNYQIENGASIELLRTFDMGENTTLQFRNIESKNIEFIDSNNKEISFKVVGQYAVLSGIHTNFLAIVNSTAAQVTRKDAPGQAPSVVTKTQSPTKPSIDEAKVEVAVAVEPTSLTTPGAVPSDQYLKNEISRMQNELIEIKKLLAIAAGKNSPSPAVQSAQETKSMPQDMVIVNFRDNSTQFEITQQNKPILINRARQASIIKVKGFTDSNVKNAVAEKIAKDRADSARNYLVKNGVKDSKISTSYEASGYFVGNNTTKAGKDSNRRVEIAMM
jgi:outer membrane protein OmpA-like peptidoglycan-associated protein